MKIGILTFHYAYNYGAVLQAYGLQEVLRFMGHDVEIIDYRNQAIVDRIHPFTWRAFKRNTLMFLLRVINVYVGYTRRMGHFRRFVDEYLHTSQPVSDEELKNLPYDAVFIGSDQVWNPFLTSGPDLVYWGQRCHPQTKIFAYAASSGDVAMFNSSSFADIDKWLKRFSAIGVRETRLKTYIDSHATQPARVVLDPTLMAGREVYERIAAPRKHKEPYILVYSVEHTNRLMQIARYVARQRKATMVFAAPHSLQGALNARRKEKYINATVPELLSLIKHAESVVALSFHGTALSLIFEKEFYSVKGGNMARVETLLNPLHLSSRIVESVQDIDETSIDYSEITPLLKIQQEKSKSFLVDALATVSQSDII